MLAQNTVCAVVKLELNQEATLEREAFDAHLALENGSGDALQDLFVNVSITDDAGQPADGAFFVKINSLAGTNGVDGSGVVQSSSTADIHWLIIPSTGAGGTNPLGRSYSISASISFSNVGAPQFVQTLPARITVKPQPALKLEYLLPFEVFADQPLTPEIEPVEPFPLGVRVTNVGFGTARNFKIDSAQPQIAEDKQGLLVDFKLLGTVVSGKTVPNTLIIPFGDIPAGSVSLAEWTMATTLSGRFTQFSSTFTHAAELGGQLTSLIQQVTTYTLLRDVAVDLPGRDAIPDFLVNVSQPRGEGMQALLDSGEALSADMILESDQAQPLLVVEAPSALTGQLGGGNMQVTLDLTGPVAPNAWVHTSVPFPDGANASVLSARRADGTIVNPKNVWVSKHFRKSDKTTLYRLNVLDFSSTATSYVLQFSAPTLDPPPGAVTDLVAATGRDGGQLRLIWTAPGEDGHAGNLLGGRYLVQTAEDPNATFSFASAQINRSTSTSPGNREDFLASGLIGNTTFFLRLWTQDPGGNISPISNAATAYALPNPPTSPAFVSISTSALEINWQPGNNRSPTVTLVSLSASPDGLAISSSPLLDASTRDFIFTNLTPNTSYFASGRGLNPVSGASSSSSFGLAVTSAEVPAPAPFSDIGTSSVTAHWTMGANPVDTEFLVELSTFAGRTPLLSSSGWIRSSQFVFPDLSPATTYYAQVKGRNRAQVETAYADLGAIKTSPVDNLPPRTAFAAGAPRHGASPIYVAATTPLSFSVMDDKAVEGDGIGLGVARTFFAIDSSSFAAYAGTFTLTSMGTHTLQFYSVDILGNAEVVRSTQVVVDGLPARTAVAFGEPRFAGDRLYLSSTTPIEFSTADDLAAAGDGFGVGVAQTLLSIDSEAFEAIASSAVILSSEGAHVLAWFSRDLVDNSELVASTAVAVDLTSPLTHLLISTPMVSQASGTIVGPTTIMSLSALDPFSSGVASGLKDTFLAISTGVFALAPDTFTLSGADGARVVAFYSRDNVFNAGPVTNVTVLLDATPPVSTATIGAPLHVAADGTRYITPATPVAFSAQDEVVSGVASGLDRIEVGVDGAPFVNYISTLSFAEGRHTVLFRAVDRVGNVSQARTLELQSDATPPVTALEPSSAFFTGGGRDYAPAAFTYALPASDPEVNAVASGASETLFHVDGSTFALYTSTFSLAEGVRRVDFHSADNVGNLELLKSATVFVDATPPVTALSIGAPQYAAPGGTVFVGPAAPFTLSAQDPIVQDAASGVSAVSVRVDLAPFAFYATAFTLSPGDGPRTVNWFASDNVGNAETPKLSTVTLDATAPLTSLLISGGRQFAGPDASTFYASSDTRLVLVSADPVVNGAAAGVAFTRWQNNAGTFTAYVSSLSLAEGSHLLAYQSSDNVENLEVLRSTNVWIDATPPAATVSIGAPAFTAMDGTVYVATTTPIAFFAADPVLPGGRPGSGLARIETSLDGAPFAPCAAALTLAEGRHVIVYRAVDNVGNVSAAQSLAVRSDAESPVSTLAIGAPQFALSTTTVLVSSRTPFSIAAVDPSVNDVASGVKDTYFRVFDLAPGTSAFAAFAAPFTMAGGDADKVIEFFSRDNVLNTETIKSSAVLLDSTPPEAVLLSPASCGAGICRVLKGRFPVLGTARDLHFGNYRLEYAAGRNASTGFAFISSGTLAVSSGTLGTWDATALNGWQTLRLTAADQVLNVSVATLNVFLGDPGKLLVLGNHEIFDMPEGVAIGADDKIYVADRNNDRIAVFSSTGALLASFGGRKGDEDDDHGKHQESTSTLRLNKPSGVAVDAAGNVYVADTNSDRVLKLSAEGQVLFSLGRRGGEDDEHSRLPGRFHHPAGVAVDAAENIYVADTENHRVQVFNSTGAFNFQFDLPPVPAGLDGENDDSMGKPFAVALDLAGNIYVADPKGGRALKFGAAGQLLLTIPIPGDKPGTFGQPFGIAVSTSGDCVLVADRKTSRIHKFDFLGNPNLAFGAKGKVKDDDAPTPSGAITLKKPMGLALDAQGNLFVADRNNDRIQKFGLPTGQAPLIVPPSKPEDEHVARDVVDTEDGGTVSRRDRAAVDIPAGAVDADLKVTVSTPTAGIADESSRRHAVDDKQLKVASPPVEYGPEGTKFAAPVTLTLPYSPDLVALAGVNEADLKVHYWNRDKAQWEDLESVVDPKTLTVKAKTKHFSLYQVFSGTAGASAIQPLAGADATFTFRDAYAFPNPARGVNSATIRIQTGLADSVEVRVYDVSGRKIHSSSNFSLNPNLDDGNGKGAQYTYDHVWDVSGVGSGVYQYVLTAKKAGQSDIHKAGRIGVVK